MSCHGAFALAVDNTEPANGSFARRGAQLNLLRRCTLANERTLVCHCEEAKGTAAIHGTARWIATVVKPPSQ